MANRLDDIFQNKLSKRSFRPEQGDWNAMKQLIDSAPPPSPSSSFSLNWLVIGLSALIIGTSIYFGINYADSNSTKQASSSELTKNGALINQENNIELTNTVKAYEAQLSQSKKHGEVAQPSLTIEQENTLYSDKLARSNESTSSFNTSKSEASESIPFYSSPFNAALNSAQQDQSEISFSKTSQNEQADVTSELSNTENSDKLSVSSTLVASDLSNSQNSNNSSEPSVVVASELSNAENSDQLSASSTVLASTLAVTQFSNGPSPKKSATKSDLKQESSDNIAQNYTMNENSSSPDFLVSSYDKQTENSNYYPIDNAASNSLYLRSSAIQSFKEVGLRKPIVTLPEETPSVQKVNVQKAKRTLPLQFSVAAFGEVSFISKKITGEQEFSSLINLRNQEEQNKIGFGYGIEFQTSFKQIGFSTGFKVSNYGENIQYEEKYYTEWELTTTFIYDTSWTEVVVYFMDSVPILNDSAWFVFEDSMFVTVVDTILTNSISDSTATETALGLAKQNGNTTVSYFEIPLYFSYQFDIKNFYLSPGAGVNIGFLKVTKGYYMAKDLNSLVEIGYDYSVMRKTLFTGQLYMGVGYRLGDKFSVEFTPSYKFNLSNIFEKPDLIQKYTSFSLQFRLRYHF